MKKFARKQFCRFVERLNGLTRPEMLCAIDAKLARQRGKKKRARLAALREVVDASGRLGPLTPRTHVKLPAAAFGSLSRIRF